MNAEENRLRKLNTCLSSMIGEYEMSVADSLREMEKFSISEEDFRKESLKLNVASYVLGFLKRAKKMAEEADYKTAENFIRFHRHQLETKANGELDTIKIAQSATISCLSTITVLYLDN